MNAATAAATPLWIAEPAPMPIGRAFAPPLARLHCPLCIGMIEKALGTYPGIDKVAVSLTHELVPRSAAADAARHRSCIEEDVYGASPNEVDRRALRRTDAADSRNDRNACRGPCGRPGGKLACRLCHPVAALLVFACGSLGVSGWGIVVTTALLRSRIGRTVLSLALLVATQFAFAGQACRAVMVGGFSDACIAVARICDPADASHALSCGCPALPDDACLRAAGDGDFAVVATGGASSLFAAPPARDRALGATVDASSMSNREAMATAAPPLPSYIIFLRFLS